jgi:hypothetical protein
MDSKGRLRTKLYDNRDDFTFPIVKFPFICSKIQAAPGHGEQINSTFIDSVSMLCLSGNVKTKRSEQLPNFLQKIRNNRRSNRFL